MMIQRVEILLIEDDAGDADLTIRALEKKRLANNLVHFKDGAQALDFLFGEGEYVMRDVAQSPRVILLDLKLPKMSGIEVLIKIRADERTMNIPVVILTSSAEDPDMETCYCLGANSYIVKPLEFKAFVKAVSSLGTYWLLHNHSAK